MYKKIIFDTLPSSNAYLKQNYRQYEDKTVIICDKQTDGHGRLGRNWESSSDNIALSILLKPQVPIASLSLISLMTSAAIFNVISKYVDNVKIKWPNDILIGKKKVCGILLESIISNKVEALIIGIGINVNGKNFSLEVSKKATSLVLENKKSYDKMILIDEVIAMFADFYQAYLNNDHTYLDICRKYSSIIGRNVKINDEDVYVFDIADNGNLKVRKFDGAIDEVAYGEITLTNEY